MAKLLRRGSGSASSFSSGKDLASLDAYACNGDVLASSLSAEHHMSRDDASCDDFEEAAEVCIRLLCSVTTTLFSLNVQSA